jgi:hypothetical protein
MKTKHSLPIEYQKKYPFIDFFYLPFLLLLSLLLGTWIAKLLQYKIDIQGIIFVIILLAIIYIIAIRTVFSKMKEKAASDPINKEQ